MVPLFVTSFCFPLFMHFWYTLCSSYINPNYQFTFLSCWLCVVSYALDFSCVPVSVSRVPCPSPSTHFRIPFCILFLILKICWCIDNYFRIYLFCQYCFDYFTWFCLVLCEAWWKDFDFGLLLYCGFIFTFFFQFQILVQKILDPRSYIVCWLLSLEQCLGIFACNGCVLLWSRISWLLDIKALRQNGHTFKGVDICYWICYRIRCVYELFSKGSISWALLHSWSFLVQISIDYRYHAFQFWRISYPPSGVLSGLIL